MLAQRRVAPFAVGLVVASTGTGPAPMSAFSTAPTVPARIAWPLGYSGCRGASMRGVQEGSRVVASLPSMSPLRIAVSGRQKLYWYLASKTLMSASSIACATAA